MPKAKKWVVPQNPLLEDQRIMMITHTEKNTQASHLARVTIDSLKLRANQLELSRMRRNLVKLEPFPS